MPDREGRSLVPTTDRVLPCVAFGMDEKGVESWWAARSKTWVITCI